MTSENIFDIMKNYSYCVYVHEDSDVNNLLNQSHCHLLVAKSKILIKG